MPCVLSVVLPSFSVKIDDREKLAKYVRSFRSLPYAATEIADYCFNSYWREKKNMKVKQMLSTLSFDIILFKKSGI